MKSTAKRIIKFSILIALLTGTFLIGSNQGYKKGVSAGRDDVIVTNSNHDKGFYFSEYKGQINIIMNNISRIKES